MCFWVGREEPAPARDVQSSFTLRWYPWCIHHFIRGLCSAWVGPLQGNVHAVRPFPCDVLVSVPLSLCPGRCLYLCWEGVSSSSGFPFFLFLSPPSCTRIRAPASLSLWSWDWTSQGVSSLFLLPSAYGLPLLQSILYIVLGFTLLRRNLQWSSIVESLQFLIRCPDPFGPFTAVTESGR